MKITISKHLICSSLIGVGVIVSGWQYQSLEGNSEVEVPLNIMGINRSPYGEVIAIAMQGAIDTSFHFGLFGSRGHGEHGHVHDENCGSHGHDDDHDCSSHEGHDHEPVAASEAEANPSPPPHRFLEAVIARMKAGHTEQTNQLPPSEALKRHMRREAENKLSFAYQLDPSHYNNYNALHFFWSRESPPGRSSFQRQNAWPGKPSIIACSGKMTRDRA